MITLTSLESLELTVGHGEDNFTMSRGSFRYKRKFDWKRQVKQTKKETIPSGYRLIFEDEKTHDLHAIEVTDVEGCISLKYQPLQVTADVNRYFLTIPTAKGEHYYGCGETYSEFDLKGQLVRIWVAEHQNVARISTKLIKEKLRGKRPNKTLPFSKYESYYVQPTFTTSNKQYLHAFLDSYSEFDFTVDGKITLYTEEAPHFQCESGETYEEVSYKLSKLLGRQRKLPDWLYEGGILAMQDWTFDGKNTKEGYDGCGNIDRKLSECDAAGIKVNGVWCQDWCGCRCTGFGYQVMWNWQYSESQYPNLPEKIKEWKERGVRFLGYINPFIALEKNIYEEAKAKGYCVKNKDGEDYLVTITTFPAAMVDFTNPEAYEWYKNLIKKNMIGIGMGGWMADFGEYLPVDSVLYSGEDPATLHNRWPAIWAKMNREAIEETGMQDEVFFFTRAGHTGTIEHSAMMWTGDQHVDWSVDDGLPSVIPATLSLAMSGYGITHSDVGGYTTVMHMTRSKELLMRWEEMNVFSPLWRSHEGNQPSRDVQFDADEELLRQTAHCTAMHASLAPYLKELVEEATEKGCPVMRPIFYHYDEEAAYTEKSEYLLGRDMLVAPITVEGATSRKVYLPDDVWVHLFTEKQYHGGVIDVDSEIGCPPVFVRKDSERFNELMAVAKAARSIGD